MDGRLSLKTISKLVFIFALASYARATTVTATITDAQSQVWASCTWAITLVNPTPYITPNVNGTNLTSSQITQTGSCNSSGVLSVTLVDNSTISPINTQWQITVNPLASAAGFTVLTAVSGASQSLTTALSAASGNGPLFPAGPFSYGYADAEVITPASPGATYYNVITPAFRQWTGTAWATIGSGSSAGVASINTNTGAFTFSGTGVSCIGTTCTFNGGTQTFPSGGIMVSTGSAFGTSLTAPTGTIVGTTDTQTLTNKTVDGVTPTTMAFLDATSSIQTQLNGKQSTLTLPLSIANGGTGASSIPTWNQSTTGNANTATNLSTNGTGNQVWGMNSGATAQGWQTLATGGTLTGTAVASANGVSGTCTGSPTSTCTIALGAITPTSIVMSATTQGIDVYGVGTGSLAGLTLPTNYVGILGPASGTPTYMIALPATAPTANQFLQAVAAPATLNGVNQLSTQWATVSGGGGSMDTITGSAAQATGTETAAGHQYTWAGVETAALTYPFVFTNANSTGNTTSGALIVQTTGTSTAAVPFLINEATAAGNLINMLVGATVTNGVVSGGTSEFSVSAAGTETLAGAILMASAQFISWNADTRICRAAANVIEIGTTACNNAGSIEANAFEVGTGSAGFMANGFTTMPNNGSFAFSSTSTALGTVDTQDCRIGAGIVGNENAATCTATTAGATGSFAGSAFQISGAKFTVAGTGCTPTATHGGATGGTITLATGPCTVVTVTMGNAGPSTATTGFTCHASDQTAPTVLISQTASSGTTAAFSIPAGAGTADVINFGCEGYNN